MGNLKRFKIQKTHTNNMSRENLIY